MRQSTFEALETRQLMTAVTYTNSKGELSINGSYYNDTLLVAQSANKQYVQVYAIDLGTNTGTNILSVPTKGINHIVIHGNNGHDNITIGDFDVPCTLTGEDGNDTLTGSANPDYLFGGDGHDVLDGKEGDDYVLGGKGDDTLRDSNTYGWGSGSDRFSGGDGIDRVDYGDRAWGVKILLDGSLGSGEKGENDVVYGDVEWANGTGGDDYIVGNSAANVLNAFGGNDLVDGMGGDDCLRGGYGNDTLNGGTGKDYLIGGVGSDVFYANDGKGGDVIWGQDMNVYDYSTKDWDEVFVDKNSTDVFKSVDRVHKN